VIVSSSMAYLVPVQKLQKSSFRRMPDKSAKRVERLKVGPKGERSESSSNSLNVMDPGLRRGDENLNYVRFWTNTTYRFDANRCQ
jgi:hypothetical protein